MLKELAGSNSFAKALREARKQSGITQAELAERAGFVERTARALEHGKGSVQSFHQALKALNFVIYYRNAPQVPIAEVIRILRGRRQLSQRELARAARVSHPTIASLEKHGSGQLQLLERVLTVLGAGHYLASEDHSKAFFTTVGNSSVGMAWTTPTALLEILDKVFGRWDLDPCSPRNNGPVNARVRFTAEDDGLSLPWKGRVFANPPYGRGLRHWVRKAREEHQNGNAKLVVLLIPARTDTTFFHEHITGHAQVVFLKGRLRFGNCKQPAPFPSALVCYGVEERQLTKLRQAMGLGISTRSSGELTGNGEDPGADEIDLRYVNS